MKRGKDEDKVMGPMFPRLHVNDTNKGGPRAPPRNKMALYEQLSIPSQRHSQVLLPRNPSGSHATVPSSSQGGSNERDVFLSYQLPSKHQSEKQDGQYSDISTPLTQVEQRKKLDEDDFRVPIFVHSVQSQERSTHSSNRDREKLASKLCRVNSPSKFQISQKMRVLESGTMQEGKIQRKENSKKFGISMVKKKTDSPASWELADDHNPNANGVDSTEPALCFEAQTDNERHSVVSGENITSLDKRNSLLVTTNIPELNIRNLSNDAESLGNRSCRLERGDSGVTETSGVDCVSKTDLTPDDVVDLIGQKRFWKARRAITNQQRVFAIQVFELHRLIKVQKLLAASPHLLLENMPYLSKSTMTSPVKKAPSNSLKQKGESENLSHNKESYAGNTIGKPSFPAVQNPSVENSPAPSMNNPPWCFSQQPQNGQQWLIPVMSPTEGLIYKPYSGPGFGMMNSTPMGNFYPPAYGVPVPPHPPPYQFPSHPGYFPQYSMPIMNPASFSGSSVEQMNGNANVTGPSDARCNISTVPITPIHQNRAYLDASKILNLPEDTEVEGSSSASSPADKMQDGRATTEGRNMLTLFPISPATNCHKANHRQPSQPEFTTQVIKVVPHNARSATESAARIFQSIQEERKRCAF